MKSEKKAALLVITENIEMELFSSEECCTVIETRDGKEGYSSEQVSVNLKKLQKNSHLYLLVFGNRLA